MINNLDFGSFVLQLYNLVLLLQDYNNTDLMGELQKQDTNYLEKIIKQNDEILQILKRKEENMKDKLLEETERLINNILEEGIQSNNLDYLDKLVDIHKDIKEEDKMKYMNYGRENYGYGRGSYGRDSYGRDSYGRRGRDSRGRYTGHESEGAMEGMYGNYMAYSEGRDEYNRGGSYSAKEDSMQSLEYMLECMVDFVKMLKEEASSQEEISLIDKYVRKVSEM